MKNASGNRGEWSELYTFLKLLSDGKIYAADENLCRINDLCFPVTKILREEHPGDIIEYVTGPVIQISTPDGDRAEVAAVMVEAYARKLLDAISGMSGNLVSSSVEGLEDFLRSMFITKIKTGSRQKADITFEFFDINTGHRPTSGFSVKSRLGAPSTLMNASGATNFVYKIHGIGDREMQLINSIETYEKIIDRMQILYSHASRVEFIAVKNSVFGDNLCMIDSLMPDIMGHALVCRYRDNIKECRCLTDKLCEENPMGYNNPQIYRYKFQKLFCAFALGMLPASAWNGRDQASGGYIVVKTDGEPLAYSLHNRNAFEDYLLNSTYFEAASTSKHGFASVYKENGEYFINLNAQIRFKS